MNRILFLILICLPSLAIAQKTITGKVEDKEGQGISFANIREKSTSNGAIADLNGNFILKLKSSNATLVISAVGFESKEFSSDEKKFVLDKSSKVMNVVQIVGSRNTSRTKMNSIAPVDVINIKDVTNKNGQLDLNQLLQYAAPSFNSNRQSGSDGADHIDPASLRGLGPDQTLVLLNGKRYHQSSLVNLYGSRGRGNNGTDLNTIPAAAIERIEILRDGAAAQYGSDAIAGVINIVLRNSNDNVTVGISDGFYNAKYNYDDKSIDGNNFNANINYGFKLNSHANVNLTLDYNMRDHTNRAKTAADSLLARREFGDPKASNLSFFLNSNYSLNDRSELYLFGGLNKRNGEAYAWTRFPGDERNDPAIYPNGFDPIITSDIMDHSFTLGFRNSFKNNWNLDISATNGANRFHYGVKNSLNRSMGATTPTTFDAGGFGLAQSTINLDMRKKFNTILNGFNLAFGGEFRLENYFVTAGEEASYKQYDTLYAPGSQGFPGFQPGDEISKGRNSQALYLDGELNVTKNWDVEAALRFENYSDFGTALTWKLATRYDIVKGLAIRGCANTGFRAPSLPQKYFNSTITNFVAGNAVDVLIARNEGQVANALGIEKLKQERSNNYSLGIVVNPLKNLNITIDGYLIQVKDRIVLTGQFTDADSSIGGLLQAVNVSRAQLFTNAVSTTTKGLDIVATYGYLLKNSKLNFMLAANFNKLTIDDIYTNAKLQGKEDIYFDMRETYFLKTSAPPSKLSFSVDYIISKLTATLRLTHFGEVKLANWNYDETMLDVYKAKMVTDLSLSYKATPALLITLGSSNLFNVYPDMHDPILTESGGAWDPVQMGYNGRFIFAKARLNFIRK